MDFKKLDFDRSEIGRRIKNVRIEKGISQKELSYKLGYKGIAMLGDIERGRRAPSVDKLFEISEILEVDVDYLIGKRNVKNIIEDINTIFQKIDIERCIDFKNVDDIILTLKKIAEIKEKEKNEK